MLETEATMKFAQRIGLNRVVFALSVARLGDAVGNSILFIVLPLYVAKLPAPHFHIPETIRVGILIALYGLISAAVQPVDGRVKRSNGTPQAIDPGRAGGDGHFYYFVHSGQLFLATALAASQLRALAWR